MTSGAYLTLDEQSFLNPYNDAGDDCAAMLEAAQKKRSFDDARTRAALSDLEALERFAQELEDRMRNKTFHRLPTFQRGNELPSNLYALEAAPWRGVFLVSDDATVVYGAVFSKYPHDLEIRLSEIVTTLKAAGL